MTTSPDAMGYESQVVEEFSNGVSVYHFGGTHGLPPTLVRFSTVEGVSWIGAFRPGSLIVRACTGVFTAAPYEACVVAGGRVYGVDVRCPDRTEVVLSEAVVQVVPVPLAGILLLADPWEVHAYAQFGIVWSTGRISVEGLRIAGFGQSTVVVMTENGDGEEEPCEVDLLTGRRK